MPAAEPFVSSRDKLEAVNRIAALTGTGPEDLGPGSKERKRVLLHLAEHVGLGDSASLTKVALGGAIAERIGVTWDTTCFSTGQTITLLGLDRLLEAAERALRPQPRRSHPTVTAEAEAIVNAIRTRLPEEMRMRDCVLEMQAAENPNWAQSEWAAFFFESLARSQCEGSLGGRPPEPIGKCRFDIELDHIWDFKAHVERGSTGRASSWVPLNDAAAVREVLQRRGGFGLVVLEGDATFDEGPLRRWHSELKRSAGKVGRTARSGRHRALKANFRPRLLRAVFVRDIAALKAGIRDGWIKPFQEGFRQIGGQKRNAKYQMNLGALPVQACLVERRIIRS